MAYKVRKTEKAGAKHGKGALWGTKKEAKHESSRIRRRNARIEIARQLPDECADKQDRGEGKPPAAWGRAGAVSAAAIWLAPTTPTKTGALPTVAQDSYRVLRSHLRHPLPPQLRHFRPSQ